MSFEMPGLVDCLQLVMFRFQICRATPKERMWGKCVSLSACLASYFSRLCQAVPWWMRQDSAADVCLGCGSRWSRCHCQDMLIYQLCHSLSVYCFDYLCSFAICSHLIRTYIVIILDRFLKFMSFRIVLKHEEIVRFNRFVGTKLLNLLDSQILNSSTIYV